MSLDLTCIVCGKPRDGGRLWCGAEACGAAVRAMPYEQISAIRERECLAALRDAPSDGRGVYVHLHFREESP